MSNSNNTPPSLPVYRMTVVRARAHWKVYRDVMQRVKDNPARAAAWRAEMRWFCHQLRAGRSEGQPQDLWLH